ncbi:MAG TPA: S41 family peptidase [Flavobacterium sp.]|jgi:C-terminal processing protease CtpA/Prc
MIKNRCRCLSIVVLCIILSGCEPDQQNYVPQQLRINDFVWKGMNLYYLWQQDVPELDDARFENQNELNEFLGAYSDPAALFQDLRVDPALDRFSVIYSDYRVLEGILSGNTNNNGVDYELRFIPGSATELFGWVRYILPNSDAASKDIHRGDIFYAVNGQPISVSNYRSLLSKESYTLNLANYDGGAINPNGRNVTLTKAPYSENPVYQTEILMIGDHKIGYLVYNGFYAQYEEHLNQAFAEFKSQNITDLILDLRYNSGGSIATATKLASLITGQFTGQLFAREQWNEKLQAYYESNGNGTLENVFVETIGNSAMNDLQLSKVYILTSRSTASASELVINGLVPYIEVVQIGDNTTGKNVGSITLYDSPSFRKKDRNPDHRYAMQPIVLKIVNRNGFGDYQENGLAPDYFLPEDLDNLDTLGSETEPLLSTAIGIITADGRLLKRSPIVETRPFKDVKSMNNLQNQMYLPELPN